MFWIYKCNAKKHTLQIAFGDWDDFFQDKTAQSWGSTEWVPALIKAARGDVIIAYQSDLVNGRPAAVMVSPDVYEGWKETLAIRADAEFMAEIRKGIKALKKKSRLYHRIEDITGLKG